MTYAVFQQEQTEYLKSATQQGTPSSIPHIPEKFYGDDYTVKLLNSDGIQERLDMLRAAAEIEERPFDENKEKGRLIAETAGALTKEAKLEYDKFIPAKDPALLLKNLTAFYKQMTGGDLTAACAAPEGQEKIKRLLGKENLDGISDVEKAAALTAVQKIDFMLETQDLRNTNTAASYHLITVENKAANPLGFHMSRLATLPAETREALKDHADKLLPATHDGAAWHEMTHALGTDDESKCEGFRFLKTLQKYKEPALIRPDINARLYNNLCTLETIRRDARRDQNTLNGNFRYIMPKMMLNIMKNADVLSHEAQSLSDAQIMHKTIQIVNDCAYSEKTEKAFRDLAKTCDSPQSLAQALQTVYKNGAKNPQTGALYPLVNDFIETAGYLNPSIPKEQLPAKFFAAENFASQSRNIGKIDIKQQNITLSADEKRHYQTLYDDMKEKHPQAKGQELNVLFAQAIVRDAWARKAETEAAAENPATAKNILFDKEAAARQTDKINACLLQSRNASGIVKSYGKEFANGLHHSAQKTGLQRKLTQMAVSRPTGLQQKLTQTAKARQTKSVAAVKTAQSRQR